MCGDKFRKEEAARRGVRDERPRVQHRYQDAWGRGSWSVRLRRSAMN